MKYLPTVNLWDRTIHAAICSGQLKLQVGQWVRCGDDKQLSRYVGVHNGVLDVVHGGSNQQVNHRFMHRAHIRRETIKRFGRL